MPEKARWKRIEQNAKSPEIGKIIDESEEDKIKETFYRGAWMTLFSIGNNHEPGFLEKEAESIKDFHDKMKEREEKEAEMDEDEEENDKDHENK